MKQTLLWLISLASTGYAASFDPLEHLGANSPWFAGIPPKALSDPAFTDRNRSECEQNIR
jgi:hypothetical protein